VAQSSHALNPPQLLFGIAARHPVPFSRRSFACVMLRGKQPFLVHDLPIKYRDNCFSAFLFQISA
jgi:hypothetical protein